MTLVRTLQTTSMQFYNGNAGGRFNQQFRINDDAGATITIDQCKSDLAITPRLGNVPSVDPPPSGFFTTACNFSQSDPHVVDMVVEFTNVFNFFERDSSDPQSVDRKSAGYCRMTTQSRVQFIDVFYRGTPGLFTSPDATASDPYNVSTLDGSSTSYIGNIDSGGVPTSFPILRYDITVSLTRNTTDDPLPWSTIANCLGKRCQESSYLGFTGPAVLFTGARVVETFDGGLQNYELTFVEDQIGHLRQLADRDDTGVLTTLTGSSPNERLHAKAVRVYQPFPLASFAGLLTTAETNLINGIVT